MLRGVSFNSRLCAVFVNGGRRLLVFSVSVLFQDLLRLVLF